MLAGTSLSIGLVFVMFDRAALECIAG